MSEFSNNPLDQEPGYQPATNPENHETDKNKKSFKTRLIIGGAGVALAATAVFGIGAISNGQAPEKSPTETSAPGQATPEGIDYGSDIPGLNESIPNTSEFSVESVEIPANLSAEELGTLVVQDRFTKWYNAGFSKELVMKWLSVDNELDDLDFVAIEAEKQSVIFADALLVSGWGDTDLAEDVRTFKSINANTIDFSLLTFNTRYDDEPYTRGFIVNNVSEIANDGTVRTLRIEYTETDNSEKNRVKKDIAPNSPSIKGTQDVFIITFALSDDKRTEKIKSISYE